MAKFNTAQSFADGDSVTGAKLNNITSQLNIYTGLISEQTAIAATVSTADQLLIADTDNGDSGAANRVTVQKLLNDTLTNGTYTNAQLSGNLNVAQLSTLGTINSTTGTIATLNSTTGTIATLNSTTGTIAGLRSTTGTVATLNSTTGTVATLNSTTGTITTLNSTTPTFLGAITASTNIINVGSGQIYKAASGNVGIGNTAPGYSLDTTGDIRTRTGTIYGLSAIAGYVNISSDGVHVNNPESIGGNDIRLGSAYGIYGLYRNGDMSIMTDGGNNLNLNTIAGGSIILNTTNTERLRINSSGDVGIGTASPVNKLEIVGSFGRGAPVTKTADFTLADTENWIIVNKAAATCTVTLPSASSWTGREFTIKTLQAFTVVSASSNVVPRNGTAAGTAILAAAAGNWAKLVSNGTAWVIMCGS
jgi:hypothetical protein